MEQAQSLDPHRPERCPETFGAADWPYTQRCILDQDHDGLCQGSKSDLWCRNCIRVANENAPIRLECWYPSCAADLELGGTRDCCEADQYTKCTEHGGVPEWKPPRITVDVKNTGEYL